MADPIRLCLLSSSSCIGGLEKLLYHLAKSLDGRRFCTRLFLFAGRGPFIDLVSQDPGVESCHFDLTPPMRPSRVWRVVERLREIGPHIVHSFGFKGDLISRWVRARIGDPILVSTVANPDLTRPRWVRGLNRTTARRVAAFWADSKARAQEGERHLGIPAAKMRVIYPGVECPGPGGADSRRTVLAELGIEPQAPVLVILGDLRFIKGHHHVLEAVPGILAQFPQATFLFIGVDTTGGTLAARARRSGFDRNVRFLGFRADPVPYLEAADLLLQPSLSEGLPRAVLEAMALGKPVVASTVGGLPEVIDDGRNGCLVAPGDPAALAHAALELLADPERARHLGRQGQKTVQERFRLQGMVGEFERFYDSLRRPERLLPQAASRSSP